MSYVPFMILTSNILAISLIYCISKYVVFLNIYCIYINISNYPESGKDNPPQPPQRSHSLFAKTLSDPSMLDHSYEDADGSSCLDNDVM